MSESTYLLRRPLTGTQQTNCYGYLVTHDIVTYFLFRMCGVFSVTTSELWQVQLARLPVVRAPFADSGPPVSGMRWPPSSVPRT